MSKKLSMSKFPFLNWIKGVLGAKTRQASRRPLSRRLCLEMLESRLAPASLSGGGAGQPVSIDLSINEALTIVSNGPGTYALASNTAINSTMVGSASFSPASANSGVLHMNSAFGIQITDSAGATGTSVTFNDSMANSYTDSILVSLDEAGSSVAFNGRSSFTLAFDASATGNITSSAGSTISTTVGNFALSAGGSVLLDGAIKGGVSTSFFGFTSGAGSRITALNPGNDFQGPVEFNAGSGGAAFFDTNGIQFGLLNPSSSQGPLSVVAGGSITQATAIVVTGNNPATFSGSAGAIVLDHPNNNFSGAVTLSDSGTATGNSITLFNAANLTLGDVTLGNGSGSGALDLTAQGTISQVGTILTGGAVTLTIDGAAGDILLDTSANNIAGTVTIKETNGGDVHDLALRNINPNAALPTGTPITTANAVNNLTLIFDNNAVILPALTISGFLTVHAGGAITQSGTLTINGFDPLNVAANEFTILGNFGIDLTAPTNTFAGLVSLNNPSADASRSVAFKETGTVNLANCNLGLGTLTVTSVSGDILQGFFSIEQKQGAGLALFDTTSGGTVDLRGSFDNTLTGGIQILDATHVKLENSDPLAAFPILPAGVVDLELFYLNAPVVLPDLTMTTLNVTAQGIYQTAGSKLIVPTATFDTITLPIALGNALNDFDTLSLDANGPIQVVVNDVDGIALDAVHVGNGAFTLTAGGAITQTVSGVFSQLANAGRTILNASGNTITLTNSDNHWTGPLALTGTDVRLEEDGVGSDFLLGTSVITGDLDVFTLSGAIAQVPGTTLTVSGDAMFDASGDIMLDNLGNTFGGSLCVCAGGDGTVRDSTPVDLNDASVGGTLTVHSGGLITESGPVFAANAVFDAGSAGVLLDTSINHFDTISVTSTGSDPVRITDIDDIALGRFKLGSGILRIDANNITDAGLGIIQTGAGIITFATSGNVNLTSGPHEIRGMIAVNGVNGFALENAGNIAFTSSSTFSSGSNIDLTAGGVVTLPSGPLSVASFHSGAAQTNVAAGITTTGGAIGFAGTVNFNGTVTINSGAALNFDGDVQVSGALILNANAVNLVSGTWTQGTNPLTIGGASSFNIGGGRSRATFAMTSGTINASGVDVIVDNHGTIQVGNAAGSETVVLNNVGGDLTFMFGSTLSVGLGSTNDLLSKQSAATDSINIAGGARILSYAGLADTNASAVVDAGAGQLVGSFDLSVDSAGAAHDFLAGTDIVTPGYTSTQLLLKRGGTVSSTGTVTGFQSDGDKYTITASTGAAAQLVVISNVLGDIDIVVRNAALATTLTVTTTKFTGDGFTDIGGIAANGAGAVTISAPTSNIDNSIFIAGRLVSLTIRDFDNGILRAGGTNAQSTTIKGGVFSDVFVQLNTMLASLTVTELVDASMTAERFGNITTTGDAPNNFPGDFSADLVNRNSANSALPAVGTVTVAGELAGRWDVAGKVTSVKAKSTFGWFLGLHGGANVRNGDKLGNVGTLTLGVVKASEFHSFGRVSSVTATSWSGGALHANSFGTITITGNAAIGDPGNFELVDLLASSNAGSALSFQSLGTLSVAGNVTGATMEFLSGNVGAIKVGRTLGTTKLVAETTGIVGKISSLQAGAIDTFALEARSLASLKMVGNAAVGLFGDILAGTFVLHGTANSAAVSLGAVQATRNVTASDFIVENGGMTSFTVARSVDSVNLDVRARVGGKIGSITAAEWDTGLITALTVGSINITGTPLTTPSSAKLVGNMTGVNINSFVATGATPSISTFHVTGDLTFATDGFINAPNGITSFKVDREVIGDGDSLISASLSSTATDAVGRIGIITAGKWSGQDLIANTIGSINITGYTVIEDNIKTKVNGDFGASDVTVNGGPNLTLPKVGIGSFTVANRFLSNRLFVPFGMTTFQVAGTVQLSRVVSDHPLIRNIGRIQAFQAGDIFQSALRATTVGTLKTVANSAISAFGNIGVSADAVTVTGFTGPASAPVAIGTMAIGGAINNANIAVPNSITTLTIAKGASNNVQIAAGFAANARITTFSTASLDKVRLTTRNIGTFNVPGNAALGIAGNVSDGLINILGDIAGTALGTFTASGTVSNTTFNVTDGNVTAFTAGRFLGSDLLVGFHLTKAVDLAAPTSAANWLGTGFLIGSFKTTMPFSPSDVPNTAAFRDSNVVAARLGTIALTGIDSMASAVLPVSFGVAFNDPDGAAGTLTIGGVPKAVGTIIDKFRYVSLNGL